MPLDDQILGKGVYTPREAARLIGSSPQKVLRWTRSSGQNEPLLNAHYQFIDSDNTEISFLDLIEVRVVAAMRKAGISLQSIRYAISYASEKLQISRPLVSQKFHTDGPEILIKCMEREDALVSLSPKRPGQKVFKPIIQQSLNGVEYENDLAARWRPEDHRTIVLDPTRHFGEPILDKYGISTSTLYSEYNHFNNLNYLSSIYEIPSELIEDAIDFERSLDN